MYLLITIIPWPEAQAGLQLSAFFDLTTISGLTNQEFSSLLDLSFKTIQRYQKKEKKLNTLNSEQLLKLITLYLQEEEIYGDVASLDRWFRKPAAGLGNNFLFKLMQMPGSIDLIRNELIRIEYGALA